MKRRIGLHILAAFLLGLSSTVHAKFIAYDSGVSETFSVLGNLGLVEGVDYDKFGGSAFSSLTVSEIQAYDFVFTGWSGSGWSSTSLASSNLDAALNGRIVISGQDPDFHGTYNPDPVKSNAQTYLSNMFNWVEAGSGTGLVSLSDFATLFSWTSLVDVSASVQHADDVSIISGFETHALHSGLDAAKISSWGNARHNYFSWAATGFTAVSTRSTGGGVVTMIRDATVPEPTTLALMCLGLAGIGYRRHRSKAAV